MPPSATLTPGPKPSSPRLPRPIFAFAMATALALMLATGGTANAVILQCPQAITVRAAGAPYPWMDAQPRDTILRFAEASYSCSNGTCTLSCAYAMASSVYTFLDYKVAPGVCHYTNQGQSFACSSLPSLHHHH